MPSSAEATRGFDPYRAWLNVAEVHRPLTAYQLLRLDSRESDLSAIRAAAHQQRMSIQAHRHEGPPEVWEQVRRELEEAIAILLDPDKKAAYDRSLPNRPGGLAAPDAPATIAGREQGGIVPCLKCAWSNPAVRRFCANCGTQLWDACFQCGTLCIAGERYCGACGANLVEGLETLVAEFETAMREAARLRAENRYGDAIAALRSMTKVQHARLAPYAERAAQWIQEIELERDRRTVEAEEAYERAQAWEAERDYEGAARLLEAVPAAIRSDAMRQLLARLKERQAEIAALVEELESITRDKNPFELAAKVSRLLVLKPDHARALQVGQRLRDRFTEQARALLARRDYEGAGRLLDQIPPTVRSAEVVELRRQAVDLVWLLRNLRNAAVVDQPLVRFADRLAERIPDDARIARLRAEIRRRAGMIGKDARRAFPPWAAPPEGCYLGHPIDWLTGFRRIAVKPELMEAVLARHPGRLYVACGLALQGLELAPVRSNLFPSGEQSMFGRVSRMLRKRPARSAWGLDLGSSGLKAVKLVADHEHKAVRLEDVVVIDYRKLFSEAVNEDEARKLLDEAIGGFCAHADARSDRICLGVPGRLLLTRRLKMPAFDAAKMDDAVAFEARRLLPVPLPELVWGYHVMPPANGEAESTSDREIIVTAMKRFQLLDRLSRLQHAKLHVDVVQSDTLAMYNFLVFDRIDRAENPGPGPSGDEAATALLDVGGDNMNFVVASTAGMWFRSSGLGGQQFTKTLVREFRLTTAQAEQIKQDPAKADSPSEVYQALDPALERLAEETRSLIDAFRRSRPGARLGQILGCGGSFQLHGLLRYLRSGRC